MNNGGMRSKRLPLAFLAITMVCGHAVASGPRDPFLDEVQHRAFLFFWRETDPVTGVTKDRANAFKPDTYDIGSIAATGFALAALPIGVERHWISREEGHNRAMLTLEFFEKRAPRIHGVFPHFLKFGTGERAWECEYSTIDTTLLLAGAITAGQYFGGDVKAASARLYNDVDWKYWSPRGFVCMGSRPQDAEFLGSDYNGYSEALLLYVVAIGSPTHPVPAGLWDKLGRWVARYRQYSTIAGSSLFVNQYQNLFVDFRGKSDGHADYWEVAKTNTLANRQFCIDQAPMFPGYGPDVWGLTAGDGPGGYDAFSAEPGGANHDGTINPHAAGGSFMFTPAESRRALRTMLDKYRDHIWGRYGFSDGFNVGKGWWASDVVGIDTGATLLSIENQRTGLVQRLFMKNPAARTAMRRIGFKPVFKGPAPSIKIAEAAMLEPGVSLKTAFRLPAKPRAWLRSDLILYGGVVEERSVRISLNGRPIGSASAPKGVAYAAALRIPEASLRWGKANTVTVTLEPSPKGSATYGPILIGPKDAIDAQPLVVRLAPATP